MAKEKCEKDATCETCNQSSSCSQQEKEARTQERLKSKLSHIKHRVMVMSGKGGVGKSSVATNLAVALSQDGFPMIGIVENMSGLICPHCHKSIPLFKQGGGEKASRDLNVPFLGRIRIDPEMVIDCDRGIPFVAAHADSEAAKAFKKIAERMKEYIGFKETEKEKEMEKFPYHSQKPEVKR